MALFGNKKTKNDDPVSSSAPVSSMKDLYSGETPTTKKSGSSKKSTVSSKYQRAHEILIKPLVTEKATNLSTHNQYVFMVASSANKIEIAKAISSVYHVKPLSINLVNVKGKKVTRGRIRGVRKDWKKAIVTLAAGQTIKMYEGV